jgi:hypothetical protein
MPFTQALRWPPLPQSEGNSQSGIATYTPSSTQQAREVNITLPDASCEPAAMAVLAGLYQVAPWSTLLADLTPQQQVHAAVLADMWQLTAAREAALGALLEPTNITDSFLSNFPAVRRSKERASAALDQLLRLECMPDCLLPVFEQMLLSKYGHLEDVWADTIRSTSLQGSLLGLPLSAMELLLASDKLKVGPPLGDTIALFGRCHGWYQHTGVLPCSWLTLSVVSVHGMVHIKCTDHFSMLSVKHRHSASKLDPRSNCYMFPAATYAPLHQCTREQVATEFGYSGFLLAKVVCKQN